MEIAQGILNAAHPERNAITFSRKFSGMNVNNLWEVAKYIDLIGRAMDAQAMQMLEELREIKIPTALSNQNIIRDEVDFSEYRNTKEEDFEQSSTLEFL